MTQNKLTDNKKKIKTLKICENTLHKLRILKARENIYTNDEAISYLLDKENLEFKNEKN